MLILWPNLFLFNAELKRTKSLWRCLKHSKKTVRSTFHTPLTWLSACKVLLKKWWMGKPLKLRIWLDAFQPASTISTSLPSITSCSKNSYRFNMRPSECQWFMASCRFNQSTLQQHLYWYQEKMLVGWVGALLREVWTAMVTQLTLSKQNTSSHSGKLMVPLL